MSSLRSFFLRQAMLASFHAVGVLLALSPFDFWPLGIAAIVALAAASASLYQAGFGRVIISWLLFAFATTFVVFGWILATIHRFTGETYALSFFLAILYAILFQGKFAAIFLFARRVNFSTNMNLSRLLAASAFFAVAEWMAPELFPWSWGNTVAASGWLRQLAAIGSVYFVSLVAVFLALLAWQLLWVARPHILRERFKLHSNGIALAFSVVAIGAILYYWPLSAGESKLRTLVVQTNIGAAPEQKRTDRDFATDAINRLFNQSIEGAQVYWPLDLIVWPEASMPFHSADSRAANESIYSPTFDATAEYISRRTGAALVFHDMHQSPAGLTSRLALRPDIGTENYYLKRRLVPWGEFLPFGQQFSALRNFFPEAGHYVPAGELNEVTLQTGLAPAAIYTREQLAGDLPFLTNGASVRSRFAAPAVKSRHIVKPAICYEALYPGDVRTRDAAIIINLSNDAWFGDGIEGNQHASAAVLRAVENGIPMVRAAMSGVTAIVDAKGSDIVPRSLQGRAQNIFAEIALSRRYTIFSRFGMAAFLAVVLACFYPLLLERFIIFRTAGSK